MATCQQQAAINSFRATRWRWKSKDKNISANTWKRRDKDLTFQMFASRRSRSVFVQEILVIFLPAVCFEKEIKWIVRMSLKWPLRSVSSRIHGVTPSSRKRFSGKLRKNSTICAQVVSRVVHDAAAWWLHHGAADPDHCSDIYFGECAFRVGAGIRCTKCCFGWSTD